MSRYRGRQYVSSVIVGGVIMMIALAASPAVRREWALALLVTAAVIGVETWVQAATPMPAALERFDRESEHAGSLTSEFARLGTGDRRESAVSASMSRIIERSRAGRSLEPQCPQCGAIGATIARRRIVADAGGTEFACGTCSHTFDVMDAEPWPRCAFLPRVAPVDDGAPR
jgi:hypothetical protein